MNLLAPISGWFAKLVKGLAAAAFGGAVTVLMNSWADPARICFTSDCLQLLGKEALVGAFIAVLAYFKQPPRGPLERTREEDTPIMGDRRSGTSTATSYKGKGQIK